MVKGDSSNMTTDSARKPRVLIVDDEEGIRSQIKWALSSLYDVLLAGDANTALEIIKSDRPDVATFDIALSSVGEDTHGMDLLVDALGVNPGMKIIMVTGNEDKQTAINAIRAGAYDYFQKPVDLDELKIIIKRALYVKQLESENKELQSKLSQGDSFQEIIGASDPMRRVFKKIGTIASSDYTVLVTGESGTGKELVAKALHARSQRQGKPFITINCGAIPDTLLEAELFGHEKGAFTDAIAQKKGKFESADHGTLFLDEIGELSLLLQVKLLRFLQDQTIERIGGNVPIKLDVRIIAATNKNLMDEVGLKAFRDDLYYRLSVITIELPPLRDRADDVVLLANYFLERFSAANNRAACTFDRKSIARMHSYEWPGNVRELENRIKRAVILAEGRVIKPSDMGFESDEPSARKPLAVVREEVEREYIMDVLRQHDWNVSRAASDLSVSRTTLYDLLEKYGIKRQ
jgi:two-component system NtrC family response regulator